MKHNRKLFLRGLGFGLAAVILLLDVLFFAFGDEETSQLENRTLQQLPTITWSGLTSGRTETELEDYVADQFPFRNSWVRVKSTVDRLMGKTESNDIFLAKDGYLIQDFTEPEEDATAPGAITTFAQSHTELNCYALVAPTAITIYQDKLPSGAVVGDENKYLEELAVKLVHSGVVFVDVRKALSEQTEEQLYYRTDHHWTTAAAYTAYTVFAQEARLSSDTVYTPVLVSDSFQGTLTASSGFRLSETDELYVYLPQDDTTEYAVSYVEEGTESASCYETSMLSLRDQYELFFGGNHAQVNIKTSSDSERVLLVLKDSYANCFVPFLLGDYQEIIMIDPRYFSGEIEDILSSEGVTDVLFLYNATTLATDQSLAIALAE